MGSIEGKYVGGDYRNMSSETIDRVLSKLASNSDLFVTVDSSTNSYVICKSPLNVPDGAYIALCDCGDIEKGKVYFEDLTHTKEYLALSSSRFRSIVYKRYGDSAEEYLELFELLLKRGSKYERIEKSSYDSCDSITSLGHTLSDVIDELLVCNSLFRRSLEENPNERLQIDASFLIGLGYQANTFYVRVFKDPILSSKCVGMEWWREHSRCDEGHFSAVLLEYGDMLKLCVYIHNGLVYSKELSLEGDSVDYLENFCMESGNFGNFNVSLRVYTDSGKFADCVFVYGVRGLETWHDFSSWHDDARAPYVFDANLGSMQRAKF